MSARAYRSRMLDLLAAGQSLVQVGRTFGISPQRVHQICRADPVALRRQQRRARNKGEYTCSRCHQRGHTRRSPDCPKQGAP